MPGPLHWFRNPQKLSDEALVERLVTTLVQLKNSKWEHGTEERAYLEGVFLVHLREVEKRIGQERLFELD